VEDYFLASRNVGWFAIGASLFVSNISTEHFIGLAGSGATSGLAVGHFEWLACLMPEFQVEAGKVTNGDIAHPTMIVNLLPVGLVGLMIAALLAALMGAMSAVFNSASTMVTLDFYQKIRPSATERELVNFGRIATGLMVVLGLLWVPFIHLLIGALHPRGPGQDPPP
jgi:uncharacterized sodium:solute symporter family permease YidK